MKFKIKRLTALVSLALLAGSASAGNLCYLGLPGMGCSNAASGKADSTGNTWVGAQNQLSPTPWMPPAQDSLQAALIAASAGELPEVNIFTPGYQNYQVVTIINPGQSINAGCNGQYAETLLYNKNTDSYAVGSITITQPNNMGCGGQ